LEEVPNFFIDLEKSVFLCKGSFSLANSEFRMFSFQDKQNHLLVLFLSLTKNPALTALFIINRFIYPGEFLFSKKKNEKRIKKIVSKTTIITQVYFCNFIQVILKFDGKSFFRFPFISFRFFKKENRHVV
jgi:hypothetical protein